MRLFVFFYLFLTLALNLYVFRRLRTGLHWQGKKAFGLAVFQVGMVGLLFSTHFLRQHDGALPVRWIAAAAFSWLAIMMWTLALGLLTDLWNLGVAAAAMRNPARRRWQVAPRLFVRALALSVAVVSVWGWVEARSVGLKTVEIRFPNWPEHAPPLRIAHLTDLHLGPLPDQRRIWNRMMRLLEKAEPDLIVATGDFIDAPVGDLSSYMREFAALDPPLGKFAVLGNHEYIVGETRSVEALRGFGFILLRGENQELAHGNTPFRIAGVDDSVGRFFHSPCFDDETLALPDDPARPWTVLLKHQPIVNPAATDHFDLQLSGHLHGGQIFPFHIAVRGLYRAWTGLARLNDTAWLYTSPGIGTWGPPLRFLARPKVVVLVVTHGREP